MKNNSTSNNNERRTIRRNIRHLALPNIVSNITIPLLSLVDVGLAGHIPNTSAIGAVAIASGAMNTLFWLFNFLRMGTIGFVAQAFGKQNVREINLFLVRGIAFALPIGIALTFSKPLVVLFAQFMAQHEGNIALQASNYLNWVLYVAPAAMLLYVLNGWFIGMQNSRAPMVAAITINVVNIALSSILVAYKGLGVEGLAIGTLVAQWVGVLLLLVIAVTKYHRIIQFARISDAFSKYRLAQFIYMGRDVFFRSAMISAVTLYFTYASVSSGELVVAGNTLLLQLFTLFSYFTDGFAYAGEALTGRYIGMKSNKKLHLLIKELFIIGGVLAVLFSLLYLVIPSNILSLLSNNPSIVNVALEYRYWIALVPIAGFAAFLWDGIFVGATYSRGLMISMLVATILFFVLHLFLRNIWANHALWLAFVTYLFARGGVQWMLWKRQFIRVVGRT